MVWNSKTYTICVINSDISISSFNSWYIGYRQGWRKVINSGEGLNSQQENFSIWWKLNPIGELLKWGGGFSPWAPPFHHLWLSVIWTCVDTYYEPTSWYMIVFTKSLKFYLMKTSDYTIRLTHFMDISWLPLWELYLTTHRSWDVLIR